MEPYCNNCDLLVLDDNNLFVSEVCYACNYYKSLNNDKTNIFVTILSILISILLIPFLGILLVFYSLFCKGPIGLGQKK